MRTLTLLMVTTFCLTFVALADDVKKGETIFMKKCKACHRLSDGAKNGPGLAGVTKLRTEEWLHKWLQDPKGMIISGDPIALEIKSKFKKTMRKLKVMQDEQNRKDVIAFLKQNDVNQ